MLAGSSSRLMDHSSSAPTRRRPPLPWHGFALVLATTLSVAAAGPQAPSRIDYRHAPARAGEDERRVDSFPVAVGRQGYETPAGRFTVTHKVEDPDWVQFDWSDPSHVIRRVGPGPDNPLGVRWIGFTSAYGWEIGFHGTPNPELLGQAVSHGCVRMRNRDVATVYDLVDVGTAIVVDP